MNQQLVQHAGNYTDINSLTSLKGKVKAGNQDAVKEAARQFEALFLQMMLSNMRKTIQTNEEYETDKSMYYDLFDKQIAIDMASKGGVGLAQFMQRYAVLSPGTAQESTPKPVIQAASSRTPEIPAAVPVHSNNITEQKPTQDLGVSAATIEMSNTDKARQLDQKLSTESPIEFIKSLWNAAKGELLDSGLNARAIIAQAALETGWGKHVIRQENGVSSHNLFGIKSNSAWQGDTVQANTLEYQGGVFRKLREGFRSYENISQSIGDYVHFIKGNGRYRNVVNNAQNPEQYALELQKAGYATDPQYANKLIEIMNRREYSQLFDSLGI